MSRTRVWFDGEELTALGNVSDLRQALLPRSIATSDVPGRDGSMYLGARLAPKDVSMTLTITEQPGAERNAKLRQLAEILARDGERALLIGDEGGLWRKASCTAGGDMARYLNGVSQPLTFRITDPVYYGEQASATVPSGGSVTFEVGGTYPALPTITAEAAGNGSGGFWRITREDGAYIEATIPSGVTTAPVVADCAGRVLRVNGQVVVLTLNADWLALEPGEHTLTMTGTGAATVEWTERWV